jgi:hypothetical protein
MKALKRLFKKSTYVKPLHADGLFSDIYITREGTPLQEFFDDWRRSGLRVAWHNLRWMMRG